MKKLLFTVIFVLLYITYCYGFQMKKIDSFTIKANEFLKANVYNGSVDYIKIKKSNPESLSILVTAIKEMNVDKLSPNHLKSFYINAYNILVIQKLVDLYPISSPLKHNGFFDSITFNVAGENLTLNELENNKIRAPYKDARIHFAVVCGAKGCPELQNYAYKGNTLDQQLAKVTKVSLNSDYFIRYNIDRKRVEISKIFDWYKDDFGKNNKEILTYINKYRKIKIPISSKIGFYEYDWGLNIFKH